MTRSVVEIDPQRRVQITEVGPRDGIQSLAQTFSVSQRVSLIRQLSDCGLKNIEIGSLVSSRKVPQMAHSDQVYEQLQSQIDGKLILLLGSKYGMQRAEMCNASNIALLCSTSNDFSLRNIGRTIQQNLDETELIVRRASRLGMWIKIYISHAFVSSNENISEDISTLEISRRMLDLGCDQICFADTLAKADPILIEKILTSVKPHVPIEKIALHLHTDQGQGIENLIAALDCGIRQFDSAIGGLGGCPFAQRSIGNIATEDVVRLCTDLGFGHGVNLTKLERLRRNFSAKISSIAIA